MKLSSDPNVRYSQKERTLFDLLKEMGAARRDVSTRDILNEWWRTRERPYHAREILNNMVRSLTRKMEANAEPIVLVKSARAGPHPINLRITRRKP